MKCSIVVAAIFAVSAGFGTALAQPAHDDHRPAVPPGPAMQGPSHADWKKGGHIAKTDWGRGVAVDYHAHHLRTPPRGYEWRQVDGNYVLAAAATGLIASVILASH